MSDRRPPAVRLLIYAPHQWGSQHFEVEVEQLSNFQRDPEAFVAGLYGVKKADYIRWLEDNCSVQCAALTTRKKRCRGIVVGGSRVPVLQYVAMQGSYCERHGGLSREDV